MTHRRYRPARMTEPLMATTNKPSLLHSDVARLPEPLRRLVEKMLVEGATFEDVVQAVNERGDEGVTQSAVQNFFRSNLELQKQRVRHQVETAEALKAAFDHPRSAEGKLADAVLLTGFLGLTHKSSEFTRRDAERARLHRENLHLKQQLLRLQVQKAEQDRNLNRARIRSELAKYQVAKIRIRQLYRALQETSNTRGLGPEAMQKIQEIYGIVTQPFVPKDAEKSRAQN